MGKVALCAELARGLYLEKEAMNLCQECAEVDGRGVYGVCRESRLSPSYELPERFMLCVLCKSIRFRHLLMGQTLVRKPWRDLCGERREPEGIKL